MNQGNLFLDTAVLNVHWILQIFPNDANNWIIWTWWPLNKLNIMYKEESDTSEK